MADAQHLPQGRNQAGDRHLKFHETRDNLQAKIICQFCQTAGRVTATQVKRKKRMTATRMLGAAATLGGSLPVTGVSKKGVLTEMRCGNCGMKWDVV